MKLLPTSSFSSSSTSGAVLAVAALQFAATLPSTSALQQYITRIPNGANVPGVRAVGHTDPSGNGNGAVNNFGVDFRSAGDKWTVALCKKDSDGDGQTNGQELGDPCCQWTTSPSSKPLWVTGVSDPGVKSRTSNASRWANVNCSATAAATTSGAAPIAAQSAVTTAMMAFATGTLLAIALW